LNESKFSLVLTYILGLIFILCQIFEYYNSNFSFADGIFGSIFFLATGFHGIHVLIGTIFLLIIFIRIKNNHFSFSHILGFEFSI
jgi:heme/copper-type cytochrome/quinol oxidase subunit 3